LGRRLGKCLGHFSRRRERARPVGLLHVGPLRLDDGREHLHVLAAHLTRHPMHRGGEVVDAGLDPLGEGLAGQDPQLRIGDGVGEVLLQVLEQLVRRGLGFLDGLGRLLLNARLRLRFHRRLGDEGCQHALDGPRLGLSERFTQGVLPFGKLVMSPRFLGCALLESPQRFHLALVGLVLIPDTEPGGKLVIRQLLQRPRRIKSIAEHFGQLGTPLLLLRRPLVANLTQCVELLAHCTIAGALVDQISFGVPFGGFRPQALAVNFSDFLASDLHRRGFHAGQDRQPPLSRSRGHFFGWCLNHSTWRSRLSAAFRLLRTLLSGFRFSLSTFHPPLTLTIMSELSFFGCQFAQFLVELLIPALRPLGVVHRQVVVEVQGLEDRLGSLGDFLQPPLGSFAR